MGCWVPRSSSGLRRSERGAASGPIIRETGHATASGKVIIDGSERRDGHGLDPEISCSAGRTVSTGHGDRLTTRSVVDSKIALSNILSPCVPSTIISTFGSSAIRAISARGDCDAGNLDPALREESTPAGCSATREARSGGE
jgi:hypothetical protein